MSLLKRRSMKNHITRRKGQLRKHTLSERKEMKGG
jgi:hypothetical protein